MPIQGDCGIKIFLRSIPAYALQVPRRFLLDTTVKISKGVDEQSAFQNEVSRIFGLFQSAQEFLLAKKLQAELIASAAFGSFVF